MQWHMPIGYKVINGEIIIYEENRRIVEQIFMDYDNGISTLRIAEDLKRKGVCNANNRVSWTHASIGRILENHNYLGTEYYPQLIDTELFERVQKRREQVRAEKGRGCHRPGRDERILFGGIITCGECGEACSHIQPGHKERNNGRTAKWKCKNYIYQNRISCTGGAITDEQVKEVCVNAVNQIIRDNKLIRPPAVAKDTVSAEYRKTEHLLEKAKRGQDTADIMTLIYEKAQERYRTLEINDAGFRTRKMQEILEGRRELTGFDEELYRKLITRIIIHKNNTAEVVFLNGSRIKIGYQ
ncbi:MAG: recombinase family protein [Lachnospiraceae bacterium]|nr:recombinase family protein [Lachnospiraceae bacterium]MDE7202716.1 recombinase family protein [Lachnospiraceae bacterium]